MQLVTIDPCEDARWSELVGSRSTSVFHSPQWLRVLRDTYDFAVQARVVLDRSGVPVGGLAFVVLDDPLDERIACPPFSDFCDPIADDQAVWALLVDDLVERGCRIDLRTVDNPVPELDDRFEVLERAHWHGVDLTRPSDEIWSSLAGSARRAIRRADAHGIQVEVGSTQALVDRYFELHLQTRKYKHGLLAQPRRFFDNIHRHFYEHDLGFVALARHDGTPVGATLFLIWQDTLYYKFNASSLDALVVRPNDRVIWAGIEQAQSRGLHWVDFGISEAEHHGLVRYKRKYASHEKTVTLLRRQPVEPPSKSDQQLRALFGEMTALLTADDVPDRTTERAGDVLYRYFC